MPTNTGSNNQTPTNTSNNNNNISDYNNNNPTNGNPMYTSCNKSNRAPISTCASRRLTTAGAARRPPSPTLTARRISPPAPLQPGRLARG
jgi:hypothetical protein